MVKLGYKQTEIGVIPEDWEIKKLINLSDGGMQNGTFYESARKGTGVYFLNVGNLYETAPIAPHTLEKFDAAKDEIDRFRIKNGDLFFTRSSIVPSGIAYCNWYKDTGNSVAVFDSHVVRFKTDTEQVDPMYLYLQCISQESRKYFISNAKVATMTTIDQAQIGNCLIPVPSLVEQASIAEAASNAGSMIDLFEKLIAKKKAIKQGAMQELLTGKKRLSGFKEAWIKIKIGSMAEVYSGGTPNTSEPAFWGGKIPWMNSGELNLKIVRHVQGRITKAGMDSSSTHFIPAECVLIGLAGQGKTRGTAAFNTFPLCTNQSIAAIYPNPDKFNSKFLYYKMDTQYEQLRELSSGDGGRGGLNKKLILDYEVAIPESIDEQTAIADILTEMDDEIELLEQKLKKYRQVKQGMMQQLLTGKIRLV